MSKVIVAWFSLMLAVAAAWGDDGPELTAKGVYIFPTNANMPLKSWPIDIAFVGKNNKCNMKFAHPKHFTGNRVIPIELPGNCGGKFWHFKSELAEVYCTPGNFEGWACVVQMVKNLDKVLHFNVDEGFDALPEEKQVDGLRDTIRFFSNDSRGAILVRVIPGN